MNDYAKLAGRLMLAALFIPAGWAKVGGYAGTAEYMDKMGVPGMLLPLVILVEFGGGIALALGAFTRWSALALAGFCVLAAVLFHGDLGGGFWKDLALGGGLLFVFVAGGGIHSVDHRVFKKS